MAEEMEILLIDNHSDDDSIGYLRNRVRADGQGKVQIMETRDNLGYGQGNAQGIARARGEFLLIINPDNTLEPDGLQKMTRAMREDPTIGILAPQLVHDDGTIRDSVRAFPSLFDVLVKRTPLRRLFPHRVDRYLYAKNDRGEARDVDWAVGACLLIRSDLFEAVGGFDPRFFLFFEDTDLCRRVWKSGKRVVYFPSVHATDRKTRLSEGGFWSLLTKPTARIHLWSAMQYFWKWGFKAKTRD